MMLNSKILPVVLTKNEEHNIEKCLKRLKWAKKVLLFDSFSDDKTIFLAKKYSNVKIIKCKKSLDYVGKLNFINRVTQNSYIFLLDADYECSRKLVKELANFTPSQNVFGYNFKIYNKIYGKVLKENLYPSKILLFKSSKNLFKRFGHKEIIKKKGHVRDFKNYIIHEDKKSLKRWFKNQYFYSVKDSKKLFQIDFSKLTIQNKIRRIPFLMNIVSAIYYTFKLNLLRFGMAGFFYILARQVYETFLSINVFIYFLRRILKLNKI